MKNKRTGLQQLILELQGRLNPQLVYDPAQDGCFVKTEPLKPPSVLPAGASSEEVAPTAE